MQATTLASGNRRLDLSVAAQLSGKPFGVRGTWLACLFRCAESVVLHLRPILVIEPPIIFTMLVVLLPAQAAKIGAVADTTMT